MKITLQTALCEQFKIRYPLFLAGMAGGPSTPELTAAVSEAGGLGTLGAAYMEPEAIRAAVRRIRELTAAPFRVNLFVYQPGDDNTRIEEVQSELNKMRIILVFQSHRETKCILQIGSKSSLKCC